VTLGTPWKGTSTQVLAVGLDLEDIAPGSRLLHALARTSVPITAIGSRSDHAVLPFESAFGDQAEKVEITHLGHLEMLGSARVFRVVADTLSAGQPSAVPDHAPTSCVPSTSGRIDINIATASQLLTLTGIGPDKAECIVSHRDAHGPFASCDDLEKVDGIGPSTLDRIRDEIDAPDTSPNTKGDPTDIATSGESTS
jgi:competence ComEA-like helix-hairpin-helix protein